jgi:hypothetical protein
VLLGDFPLESLNWRKNIPRREYGTLVEIRIQNDTFENLESSRKLVKDKKPNNLSLVRYYSSII